MKNNSIFFGFLISVILLSCKNSTKLTKDTNSIVYAKDSHSYAEPNNAVVTHLSLDIDVNTETKKIKGTATWDFTKKENVNTIVFDIHNLNVLSVKDDAGKELKFETTVNDEDMGQGLKINLNPESKKVFISYETTDSALAIQWTAPEQTAGKKYPFMFTQSQAILCRTWIPCQDSPGIRFTYDAKVKVPIEMMALMSAKNPTEKSKDGQYSFTQPYAIPAYLMALSVGDFEFRKTGERTGVYAEPAIIDTAAWELAEMENMLISAEKLYGKYAWDRYDVLFLPPSFPFGGMENPMLTFATPTILAGDRSLTALIAHELAHSWSGNLVTNATWDDFWLNEGFTVYFERRIMESIQDRSYAEMLEVLGYGDLQLTLQDFMDAGAPQDTKLKLALEGRNPDDAVSDIAYEKGYLLLLTMEQNVGREKWDEFLNYYFSKYKFQSVTTEIFIDEVYAKLFKENDDVDKKVQLKKWIYEPGLPPNAYKPRSMRFETVGEVANRILGNKTKPSEIDTKNWTSHEYQHFLRCIKDSVNIKQMEELDAQFHFTQTGNSEIAFLWLDATIIHEYKPAYPALKNFLSTVGRRKFVLPLYKSMMKNKNTQAMAKEIYAEVRKNYHSVTTGSVDEVVK